MMNRSNENGGGPVGHAAALISTATRGVFRLDTITTRQNPTKGDGQWFVENRQSD
jgi:hypothetical protein